MIACVDSDYDYLLQGATSTSRQLIENPYVMHTYAYAIENFRCYADSLKQVCVLCTQNDSNVIDFKEFFKMYSRICYPLLVWNILLYRKQILPLIPVYSTRFAICSPPLRMPK